MNRYNIYMLSLLLVTGNAAAAGGGVHLDHAPVDVTNKSSLQRGAKFFVNYCQGCHSIKYSRYSRVGADLGLTDIQVEDNLIFNESKVRDLIKTSMKSEEARKWFGSTPPDLSVVARSKGADWLYTYLRTFYLDESRPLGVNNLVLENVSMPHVLWELQGWQKAVYKEGTENSAKPVIEHLELAQPGQMTPEKFDRAMLDLVNFLTYVSEPAQLQRKQIGLWVLLFLVLLFVVTFLLKKDYWRDVH